MRRVAARLARAGVLAAATFGACSARAEAPTTQAPSSAAGPVENARARYREGVDAYRSGHYRESIDYFLEADRLSPSAVLSFNIALAYEKIDDPAAALRWYRDYLRRAPDAKDKASVEATVHGFEQRLAAKGVQQVTVFTDPSGATLALDGKPVGVTPFTTEIPPGTHRIELSRDGYDAATQSVDVPADHATDIQVTLRAAVTSPPPVAAPPAAPVPPSTGSAPEPPHEAPQSGPPLTTFGIVGLAAGGAALGGALTFELLRRSAESDAKSERTQVGYADRVDTMQSRQTAARVLLGTGVVLAATGGVFLYFGQKSRSESRVSVGLACAPGGCASSVRGRF